MAGDGKNIGSGPFLNTGFTYYAARMGIATFSDKDVTTESTIFTDWMLDGSGAFALLSLDGDNAVQHGQSAVILPAAGQSFAASGNKARIRQGGTLVDQTITAEGASSITITVDLTGMTVPGSATLEVGKP